MKAFAHATFVATLALMISATAHASSTATRVYSITNAEARLIGCPVLAAGAVQTKSATSTEIDRVGVYLENGMTGEATQFRHVSQCLSAAPCDAYDVGVLTTTDGQKMTLMFRHNTDRKGFMTAGFAELSVLTPMKTCAYSLTDMGPGFDLAPLD